MLYSFNFSFILFHCCALIIWATVCCGLTVCCYCIIPQSLQSLSCNSASTTVMLYCCANLIKVTTNLANWGYSGDFYEHEDLGEFCPTVGQIFNKQNSFSSVKYLYNTSRSWASNEQSIVNFGDGHSVLMTCYLAGVDMEWPFTLCFRKKFVITILAKNS